MGYQHRKYVETFERKNERLIPVKYHFMFSVQLPCPIVPIKLNMRTTSKLATCVKLIMSLNVGQLEK
jgi:hypothetical protein